MLMLLVKVVVEHCRATSAAGRALTLLAFQDGSFAFLCKSQKLVAMSSLLPFPTPLHKFRFLYDLLPVSSFDPINMTTVHSLRLGSLVQALSLSPEHLESCSEFREIVWLKVHTAPSHWPAVFRVDRSLEPRFQLGQETLFAYRICAGSQNVLRACRLLLAADTAFEGCRAEVLRSHLGGERPYRCHYVSEAHTHRVM